MFGQSVNDKLKSLDMYRKLPSELTEPTLSGAVVSLVSTAIMIILLISEFSGYLSVEEHSEMFVDTAQGSNKIRVNLDIDFPRLPCDVFALTLQDIAGSHSYDFEGDLLKVRLSKDNLRFEEIAYSPQNHQNLDTERAAKAFVDQEGCRVHGYILVKKAPGIFYVSPNVFANRLPRLFQEARINTLDVSHRLNHLSFGDDRELSRIKRSFSKQGILTPLDGTHKTKQSHMQHIGVTHYYYISIVPTSFLDLSNKVGSVYQFVANSNDLQTQHMPAMYFRYDISPVTVQFAQSRETFSHFLVSVCAIIGGVFTVAGIIDSIVHKSVVHILKKAEMGKLS